MKETIIFIRKEICMENILLTKNPVAVYDSSVYHSRVTIL